MQSSLFLPARITLCLSATLAVAGSACSDSTGPGQPASQPALYAVGGLQSVLYRVPLQAGASDSMIAPVTNATGESLELTDIARAPHGGLWGITEEDLYRIDASTARATRIGSLDNPGMNALAFDPAGRLFGARQLGELAVIDTVTGQAQIIGEFGSFLFSSGDIAFAPDGTLYATVVGAGNVERLVTVDPGTGMASPVGNGAAIGFDNVWGLTFVEGQLYGLTSGVFESAPNGVLLRIDTGTGVGKQLRPLGFMDFGAARTRPVRWRSLIGSFVRTPVMYGDSGRVAPR